MRSFLLALLTIGFFFQAATGVLGAEIRLTNGDVYRGEVASFDDNGLVVRLDIGGFSQRIGWGKLTQETLKELAKNPSAAKFAEPFIEVPAEVIAKEKKKKEIKVQPVANKMDRLPKPGMVASFSTPIGLFILALIYAANLYAAMEIARFRRRPVGVVCGLSAILPIIGPIIFLSTPTADDHPAAESGVEGESVQAPPQAKQTGPTPAAAASGLGLANAGGEKKAAGVDMAVFKRGDTTFNRRFFETKFAGFFRVVPSEAEKDLVLVVRAAKNEYVAKRVSRISAMEIHLQLLRGGTEVGVPFTDINEVQVKHKDAKA